jgi:hypothetical protein
VLAQCLNVLLSDDGRQAILMDFGSVAKARRAIRSHADAVKLEEEARDHLHDTSSHTRATFPTKGAVPTKPNVLQHTGR